MSYFSIFCIIKVCSQTTQVAERLKKPELICSMKSRNKKLTSCFGSWGLSRDTAERVTSDGFREGWRDGNSDRSGPENSKIVSTKCK